MSPWEPMLDRAVTAGLASAASVAPVITATPVPVPVGLRHAVLSPALTTPSPSQPPALPDEREEAAAVEEAAAAVVAVGDELRGRVRAATARSVQLLRSDGSGGESRAAALRGDVETWLLEAGRLEAVVDDALRAAAAHVRERESAHGRTRAELHACRRALEVQLASASREGQELAALREADERERDDERLRFEAEVAQARAEALQLRDAHAVRLRDVQAERDDALGRETAWLVQAEADREAVRVAQAVRARAPAARVASPMRPLQPLRPLRHLQLSRPLPSRAAGTLAR